MSERNEEIRILTKALTLTLRSVIKARERQERRRRRRSEAVELKSICAADLQKMPIPTRAQSYARRLAHNDTHEEQMALMTVKWIGEQLHRIGGEDLMLKALERATARHRQGDYMSNIADHRWDGIGQTADRPGWCC